MNQTTQERKKYASGRMPSKQTQPQIDTQIISLIDLREQVRALDVQVQKVALPLTLKRIRRRPRLRSASADDLNHRQTALADLLAEARALVPDPPDSPTRLACRESPLDEGIVKKFRRQGFRL